MEAGELGLYMFFACAFATYYSICFAGPTLYSRRDLSSGCFMDSRWCDSNRDCDVAVGKQSGAHFNPALTLTFYRLGKWSLGMRCSTTTGQFLGALAVSRSPHTCCECAGDNAVRYAVTVPACMAALSRLFAEMTISFILMITVLFVSNRETLADTPVFCWAWLPHI